MALVGGRGSVDFLGCDLAGFKTFGLDDVLQGGRFQDSMFESLFGNDDVKRDGSSHPNPCITASGVNIRRMNDIGSQSLFGAQPSHEGYIKESMVPTYEAKGKS